jgi:predicted transcriptional regulator
LKTSVEIPDDLWKAAKILAVEERKDLKDIIVEALKEYLRKKKKAEGVNKK